MLCTLLSAPIDDKMNIYNSANTNWLSELEIGFSSDLSRWYNLSIVRLVVLVGGWVVMGFQLIFGGGPTTSSPHISSNPKIRPSYQPNAAFVRQQPTVFPVTTTSTTLYTTFLNNTIEWPSHPFIQGNLKLCACYLRLLFVVTGLEYRRS